MQSPADVRTGAFGVVTLDVTDEFGNPASGGVVLRFDDASPGRFGDGSRQQNVNLDAAGKVQVTVTASAGETGKMSIRVATPGTNFDQFGAAANRLFFNSATDDAPGFAASNAPKTVEIEIKPGTGAASITISGVRDGDRIEVNGETLGLAGGTVVRPWIRFPGQTGFTEGNGQRSVTIVQGERGEFSWGRKTGKRTAVQFRTGDDLRSNTVLIAAK